MMDWAKYAKDAKPSTGFASGLEQITNGEYTVEIVSIESKHVKGQDIIEMSCKFLTPGQFEGATVKRATFIKDQDGADRWVGDLARLGFDPEALKIDDPNEQMAKVFRTLPGLQFKAKKTSTDPGEKKQVFHNLNIVERTKTDGKPEKIGAAELDEFGAEVGF